MKWTKMKLTVNQEVCTGCRVCTLVCSFYHEDVCNPAKARIHVERKSVEEDIPHVCTQCENPPCVRACPNQALTKTDLGSIRVEEKACDACGICMRVCPNDAIRIHPLKKVAMICDLCDGDPKCAKFCVMKALEVR
ncbi:MAG: 4Fe-4S dicluster domain-containing protein [Candidatus Hadarchaeales archaeon]